MKIQLNTDVHIDGNEVLAARAGATVEQTLKRFSAHITRVEVHLGDENGGKNGQHDHREKTSGLPLSGTEPRNWSDSPVE